MLSLINSKFFVFSQQVKQVCCNVFLPRRISLFGRIRFGGETIKTIEMEYAVYKSNDTDLSLPPILAMHGVDVTRHNWRGTCRHIAKRGKRAVITVECRNHGPDGHSPYHTPKHLAADAAAFIMGHKLIRVIALGHGMGGRALMTLALTKPELVERAIFLDTTPGKVPNDVNDAYHLFEAMLKVLPTIPNELSLIEGRKLVLRHFVKLVRNNLDLVLIIMNLEKNDSDKFVWKSNPQAILDGWDQSVTNYEKTLEGLQPFQGETLLIAGKKANFVTEPNITIMKKYFPKLQVKYLDADHKVHMDQPEKFLDLITDFTKSS